MRILYFDCFNGASGDMILGALLDAGLPLEALRDALGSLAIEDFEVTAERVLRAGVSATKFRLVEHGEAAVRAQPAHQHQHDHDHVHDRTNTSTRTHRTSTITRIRTRRTPTIIPIAACRRSTRTSTDRP